MTRPAAICLIVNDRAGDHSGPTSRSEMLRDLLDQTGLEAEIRSPRPGQSLTALAHEALDQGCGTLVAAGGDGTICAVAEACHDRDATLGVVPQGTFNYFARGLGIPLDPEAAVAALAGGTTAELRLGEVNGAVFLNNASLGLYPAILERRETTYRRWGRSRAAAYWSVAQTLAGMRRAMRLRIDLDGQTLTLRTPLAFVANSAYQLQQFNLDGIDALETGAFPLFTAPDASRAEIARATLGLALRAAQEGQDFELHRASRIVIDPGRPRVLVARDGERQMMQAPLTIRRRDRPLRVLVPGTAA
ncbi:diacylglycerol kinase [Rhodovulum viride]|uniref:Diacylglycerol kinase n=1 Tax=Rhodovulum viride TaxID=1231134 RepID=A0ABX9DFH1_9RHOB|nr:diacylglycerol kinase family protein [Rhodovulum viride]RAP40325.1 diacylglycerol kinase [Rhodovulum viride]